MPEKKAIKQDLLLKEFINNISDKVYIRDLKGKLLLVNDSYAKEVKKPIKTILGKTHFDVMSAKEAGNLVKIDEDVIKKGKSLVDRIEKSEWKNGRQEYISISKILRYGKNGKINGLMSITRDVTKSITFEYIKAQNEQGQQTVQMREYLNKNKADFIAAISHELRTPLAIVKQLFSLIFDEAAGPINHKQREILVRARYNIERLRKQIDNLLQISAVQKGEVDFHYSLTSLKNLVEDSKDFFIEKAAQKNITLNYCLPKDDVHIFADADRMIQVISNLLNNAIKFTPEKGVITVEIKVFEHRVRVGVFDTGIGIDQKDTSKIFEKFVQVSADESLRKKGIGMGLAIVKELVEKHNGEIWVESKKGEGSKFYLMLPHYSTTYSLTGKILKEINSLLLENVSVYVLNVFIVNYTDLLKRLSMESQDFLRGFKEGVHRSINEFFQGRLVGKKEVVFNVDIGRYSIVLSGINDAEIGKFGIFFKEWIRDYFKNCQVGDAFVVVGISTFSSDPSGIPHQEGAPKFTLKEMFIGSEMRRHKRINYDGINLEVDFLDGTKEFFPAADLSQGGICFMSFVEKDVFPLERIVKVKFPLLKIKQEIETKARVAWLGKEECLPGVEVNQYKVGLEFQEMKFEDLENLLSELRLYYE